MVLFDLNCLIMLIAYLSTSFCPWGMDTLVLELMLIYCCSVTKLCQALCDPMDCSTAGFPVLYHLPEFAQSHVHWVGDAIQPSHPLLAPSVPSSIFPSIRIFSSELALCIRWPKYWIFTFSISPSNGYSELISFRTDLFDFLVVQGTLKSLLQHHSSKASILPNSLLYSHIHTWLLEKP